MKINYLFFTILAGLIVLSEACTKDPGNNGGGNPPPPPPPPVDCNTVSSKFSTDVNPIIQSSCATSIGCHGNGSNSGPGPLLTFDQIRNAAFSIKSAVISRRMPLTGTLSTAQIQSISCWVDNGMKND